MKVFAGRYDIWLDHKLVPHAIGSLEVYIRLIIF
jgi:hypothetical protein